jgi:hypothetical protein
VAELLDATLGLAAWREGGNGVVSDDPARASTSVALPPIEKEGPCTELIDSIEESCKACH